MQCGVVCVSVCRCVHGVVLMYGGICVSVFVAVCVREKRCEAVQDRQRQTPQCLLIIKLIIILCIRSQPKLTRIHLG